MEITEVKVFLKEGQDKKLKAYATLTLDHCFVVRNVKVIEGNKGMFVAMPSRKMKEPCPKCHFRNAVRSKYCNQCGATLPQAEFRPAMTADEAVRQSEHKDIAHPITAECRDYIQKKVLEAFDTERNAPAAGATRASVSASASASAPAPVSSSPAAAAVAAPVRSVIENDIEL